MSFIFGGERPHTTGKCASKIEDLTRESRRTLNRGVRSLQTEHHKLKLSEEADTKAMKAAVHGDIVGVKLAAKQLVRTRARCKRNIIMQSRMIAMDRRLSDISASSTLTNAMSSMTTLMQKLSKSTDITSMSKLIRDFDQHNGRMNETMNMIDESVDDMLDGEDDEDEQIDEAAALIIAEAGFDMESLMIKPPTYKRDLAAKQEAADNADETLIQARIQRLKHG